MTVPTPPTFDELLRALRTEGVLVSADPALVEAASITHDSRTASLGALYVAIRGSQADGHRFAADAVARGAVYLVVEERLPLAVPQAIVRDGRRAAVALGRAWYGDPGAALTLVGITGTNGKTTTTGLVRHLCNERASAGSIGTLGAFDGHGEAVPSTAGNLTTPGPIDLQATLAALRARGCTHVAMEASSHALDQRRLDGLAFRAAVFTNLTRDHLDYHGTMERYREAKLLLATLLAPDGTVVYNADDPAWAPLAAAPRRLGVGLGADADLRAEQLHLDAGGSRFRVTGAPGTADCSLPLLGDFNVQNALAALGAGLALGIPLAQLVARLAVAPQVPGRMERIAERGFTVLRDYAHTPDALERALATLRPLTRGRLIVVFGCGGDRDKGKRPIMGRLAAEGSDLAIVTSDNPRTEDPDAIIADVEAGMGATRHLRFTDRRAAIAAALTEGREGDTILLAGKGHEDYQVVGTVKQPFDERVIVQELLGGAG